MEIHKSKVVVAKQNAFSEVAKHVLGFSSQEGVNVLQKYVFFTPTITTRTTIELT
jgi:hypothetical protein